MTVPERLTDAFERLRHAEKNAREYIKKLEADVERLTEADVRAMLEQSQTQMLAFADAEETITSLAREVLALMRERDQWHADERAACVEIVEREQMQHGSDVPGAPVFRSCDRIIAAIKARHG